MSLGQVVPIVLYSSREDKEDRLCLFYVALVSFVLSVVPWHCDIIISNNAKAVLHLTGIIIL